jgi:hypothetical protein
MVAAVVVEVRLVAKNAEKGLCVHSPRRIILFGEVNNDDIDIVPIEGTGWLNTTKDGSTIRILN